MAAKTAAEAGLNVVLLEKRQRSAIPFAALRGGQEGLMQDGQARGGVDRL